MSPTTIAPARGRAVQATPRPTAASLPAGSARAGGGAPGAVRARPAGHRTTGEDA